MQSFVKNERGVSLISLATAIIILGMIISMLLYNVKDTKDTERISNLYIDIEGITDRVSNYYSRYGALPVLRNIDLSSDSTINEWISELQSDNNEGPLGANDTGNFYVIDMNALENLSLNYGSGFTKILNSTLPDDKDVYVINENSHNVFYLHGIKVNNNGVIKMYYTNQKKDVEKVSIQYVDEIKIPDGFIFKSGDTKNNLKIEKVVTNGDNIEYTWANTGDNVYQMTKKTVNDATEYHLIFGNTMDSKIIFDTTNGQNADDLIASAREFGGFYYTPGTVENTANIYYFSVSEDDNWGMPYGKEGVYIDKNGDRAYIPKDFKISKLSSLNTINKGLVIKKEISQERIDNGETGNGDEYVWIDVPDNVLANAITLEEIENALKDYTKDYREEGYEDTYPEGLVMTDDETKNNKVVYNELKNKMLQSIKQNGGFYIGRYEASQGTNNKAMSQKDKKPWIYINIMDAQNFANSVLSGNYTTGLIFGLQWDLVCKFLEENGSYSLESINTNSSELGNYKDSKVLITSENAKRLAQDGSNWTNISSGDYKNNGDTWLLTTGASDNSKTLNIYDLAGNVAEWILERNNTNNAISSKGGTYAHYATAINSRMNKTEFNTTNNHFGFRVTLFKTPPQTATSSN